MELKNITDLVDATMNLTRRSGKLYLVALVAFPADWSRAYSALGPYRGFRRHSGVISASEDSRCEKMRRRAAPPICPRVCT